MPIYQTNKRKTYALVFPNDYFCWFFELRIYPPEFLVTFFVSLNCTRGYPDRNSEILIYHSYISSTPSWLLFIILLWNYESTQFSNLLISFNTGPYWAYFLIFQFTFQRDSFTQFVHIYKLYTVLLGCHISNAQTFIYVVLTVS
jgi:hypothetical protein